MIDEGNLDAWLGMVGLSEWTEEPGRVDGAIVMKEDSSEELGLRFGNGL